MDAQILLWRNKHVNMEVLEKNTVLPQPAPLAGDKPEKFQPRGAIAFFLLLIVLGLIIWFGIYFLMLERVTL
jgi:hypothetical protein